ncbi:MAG: HlyD family efflux transporter periplasmic adaptor subunit [bacterium]
MTNIVHEAETQRQHPRYKIPAQVELFGKIYPVTDISVGGVGIGNADFDLGVGKTEKGKLIFPMDGYSFILDIEMELRYVRRDASHAGFRFQNVKKQTQNALRYIADAYIGGEIVRMNDILTVLARDTDSKIRKTITGESPGETTKQTIPTGYLILMGIALALILLIGTALFNRIFVNEVTQANVHVATIPVKSPAAGQLTFVRTGDRITTGDALASMTTTAEGREIVINSPCNCLVMSKSALEAAYVGKGDELAVLVDEEAVPYVRVLVNRRDLMSIYEGADVVINFPDGSHVRPTAFRRVSYEGEILQDGIVLTELILEVEKPLTLADVGNPVSVRINRAMHRKRNVTAAKE